MILWKNSQTKIRDYSLLENVAYLYEKFGVLPTVDKGLTNKKIRLRKLKNELKDFDKQHPKSKMTEVEIVQRSSIVTKCQRRS